MPLIVASLRPRRVDALAVLGLGLIKLGRFVQRRGGVRRRAARPRSACSAAATSDASRAARRGPEKSR